ncbi:MAG: DUF599 domain-containing protein [Gammaproteobacteria bacterium]
MVSDIKWLEVVLVCTSLLLLLAYHLYLAFNIRRKPAQTVVGINNQIRIDWTRHVIENRLDILAVQTLRNWTMAATFLASTSMLVALGLMSYAMTSDSLQNFSHVLNRLGSHHPELVIFKFILLIIDFFYAFFSFTQALRHYNHAAFALTTPAKNEAKYVDKVSAVVNRGALQYTLGMRALYFILPLTLWLIGPDWLLAGVCVLLVLLYRVDYRHDLKQ